MTGRSTPRSSSTLPGSGPPRSPRCSGRSSRPRRSTTSTSPSRRARPELPRDMPDFRDPDNLVYGKSEQGGMVFGGYETDPVSRWEDGVPWEHAAQVAPGRLRAVRAADGRSDPAVPVHRRRRGDPPRLPPGCHDAGRQPAARAVPGVRGFWVAAGLSLNGFGGGGGIGRAMAGWITAGDPGVDVGPYGRGASASLPRPGFAAGLGEVLGLLPVALSLRRGLAGRPRRLSPLHGKARGGRRVFGTKAGWERADYHQPGQPGARAGRDQAVYRWTRPPLARPRGRGSGPSASAPGSST